MVVVVVAAAAVAAGGTADTADTAGSGMAEANVAGTLALGPPDTACRIAADVLGSGFVDTPADAAFGTGREGAEVAGVPAGFRAAAAVQRVSAVAAQTPTPCSCLQLCSDDGERRCGLLPHLNLMLMKSETSCAQTCQTCHACCGRLV